MGFGGTGGGSGSIQTSSDVALITLTNNDVLTYNTADSKWENMPAQSATMPGDVLLDSFSGATDDDKLTAAMAYASAQTFPPNIRLTNRTYNFSIQRSGVYTGFRLIGPNAGITNAELGSANGTCRVNLSTNGAWLNVTGGDTWDAVIKGITFSGTSSTTFLGCGDGSSVFHSSNIRDCTFKTFKTILGTQSQKLLMTTCLIDGYFQMQGMYNGGIHIGGSDNRLFMNGALVDASVAYNTAGNAAGQYHFWFDGLDNTAIGALYITAEGPWGGVRVTGFAYNSGVASNRGMIWMYGCTIEGRNTNQPCDGALLRIEGGIVQLTNGYIARGMASPSTMGHSPADAGVVHVLGGGALIMQGVTYDRCNGVDESVPFVYTTSSGPVRISDITIATTGGTWSGLPQVTSVGGALVHDDTVTQV